MTTNVIGQPTDERHIYASHDLHVGQAIRIRDVHMWHQFHVDCASVTGEPIGMCATVLVKCTKTVNILKRT